VNYKQGHSKSLILVPMESSYATSYQWIILIYIKFRSVCQISRSIDQIISFDRWLSLTNSISKTS